MTTAYSSLMGLALPVQGELSGTWGDTVNNGITNYLDVALAGTQTISGSQTAVTLSLTNGNASATNIAQAGSGATGSAQYAIINCTGNPASLLTITVPASSRQYVVINATSTSQSVKVVGAGPTTGVTIVSGEKAHIVWNGSDFVKIASTSSVSSFSAGTTGLTPNSATTGAVTLAGTLATTNGGTGLTSFTANGVVYASSTSAMTTGSALTFDGSRLGVGVASPGFPLDVASISGETLRLRGTTTTGVSQVLFTSDTAGTNYAYLGSASGYLAFGMGASSEGMRLTSTGLGIGTSSPTSGSKLDVNGQIVAQNGSTSSLGFSFRSATSSGMYLYDDGVGANVVLQANANNNQLYLQRTGNVGIGTSSPAQKLHVSSSATDVTSINLVNTSSGGGNFNIGSVGSAGIWGASAGSLAIRDSNLGQTRVVLDSSGNLGLGVTPSAWNAVFTTLQVKTGSVGSTSSEIGVAFNKYYDAVGNKYIANGYASQYIQSSGQHLWYTAPSGTAGNAISFTQAMTLDASGNLGVGTTSPTARLTVVSPGTNQGEIRVSDNATYYGAFARVQATDEVRIGAYGASQNLTFYTVSSERARITSSGTWQLSSDYQEGVVTANTGTAYTISLASGTLQILTLTGNCTFTFPTATAGKSFTLFLKQDATGGRSVTWPADVKWPGGTAPTITSTASKTDKFVFTADGTSWAGSNAGQNYTL